MKALTQEIVLTHFDFHRLHGLLRVFRERSAVNPSNLDALEIELERAQTVAVDSIPHDVITMNSKVGLRCLATGERFSLTLVFPETLTHDPHRISVLSPLGLALLGCRVGDELENCRPSCPHPLLVEEIVYQPEATGNFYL